MLDHCFMAGKVGEETADIQLAKDRRTRMIFAHMVPGKGLASMHGAEEMIKRQNMKRRERNIQETNMQ